MHFPIGRAVILALSVVMGLSTRASHAQSVTPRTHGTTAPATEPSKGTSRHTIGWIVAGAGGVSLLGSGCVVLLRNQKQDEMRGSAAADIVNELQPYNTAATTLFVVGVAGIAVGLPLALIGADATRVVVSLERVMVSSTF